jgi:hypothetical protein
LSSLYTAVTSRAAERARQVTSALLPVPFTSHFPTFLGKSGCGSGLAVVVDALVVAGVVEVVVVGAVVVFEVVAVVVVVGFVDVVVVVAVVVV